MHEKNDFFPSLKHVFVILLETIFLQWSMFHPGKLDIFPLMTGFLTFFSDYQELLLYLGHQKDAANFCFKE